MTEPRSRRFDIVAAGHRGDEATARSALHDPSAAVRAAAIGAVERCGALSADDVGPLLRDGDHTVRQRATLAAIAFPTLDLIPLLLDAEPQVVEAAAFALGERGDVDSLSVLAATAATHEDDLCRESAVAALGALASVPGADRSLIAATLLASMDEKPQIRRRAVLGLHQFDRADAVAAVRGALTDRDRQVRALAGDLLGEPVD